MALKMVSATEARVASTNGRGRKSLWDTIGLLDVLRDMPKDKHLQIPFDDVVDTRRLQGMEEGSDEYLAELAKQVASKKSSLKQFLVKAGYVDSNEKPLFAIVTGQEALFLSWIPRKA